MHPSLHLHDLSRLPLSVQLGAIEAFSGSVNHLAALLSLVNDRQFDSDLHKALLPVFFANLSPTPDIPTEGLASTLNIRGACSLRALYTTRFPGDAGPDLWPHLWKWTSFLYTHGSSIAYAPTEFDLCGNFVLLVWEILRVGLMPTGEVATATKRLVTGTAEAKILLVRAWKLLLEEGNGPLRQDHRHTLINILQNSIMGEDSDPGYLEIFLDGAGGTFDDLAVLLTNSVALHLPTSHTTLTHTGLAFINALWFTLIPLINHDLRMKEAFIAAGGLSSLTRVICAFSLCPGFDHWQNNDKYILGDVLGAALLPLSRILTSAHSALSRLCREALVAGLYRALLGSYIGGHEIEYRFITEWIETILPRFTLCQSVLSTMADTLQDVDDLIDHSAFTGSPLFGLWMDFRKLLDHRRSLAQARTSAEHISLKACDNMECGKIRPKSEFKLCAYCHSTYYCSNKCQRLDWTRGEHRDGCTSLRIFGLKHNKSISLQDTKFLKEVVHHDYHAQQHDILQRQLACYRKQPSALVVTVFDYSSGHAEIQVHAASTLLSSYPEVNWKEHLRRSQQGGGRIEFHLALVPKGSVLQARMFPMRSNVPVIRDALRRLAKGGTGPSNSIAELITASREDLVQIHQIH
ncbi:hypothetical protein C8R43DRAFT_1049061 [Mycena crocata]|nr:hypothetical protein C8R43DRAFT_1049061 [Mycena crocata]